MRHRPRGRHLEKAARANSYRSAALTSSLSRPRATLRSRRSISPANAERLKGALKGITEVRIDHDTNTYRVYYVAEFECCLYIIDAGMKKSPKGREIPRPQVERLKMRRAQAEVHYKANEAYFRKTYEVRRAARLQHEAEVKTR